MVVCGNGSWDQLAVHALLYGCDFLLVFTASRKLSYLLTLEKYSYCFTNDRLWPSGSESFAISSTKYSKYMVLVVSWKGLATAGLRNTGARLPAKRLLPQPSHMPQAWKEATFAHALEG